MISCAFLIFKNFNHIIKELIPLSSGWFCSLNWSNYLSFNNRNATCVVFPMYWWCTSVDYLGFHVYLDILSFLDSLVHAYNFFIIRVRGYSWLNLYFTADMNTKESMNNTWNLPSSVDNSSMICILMTF